MYHLKLPVQIVLFLVMLHCVSTVPHNRYFLSSNENEDDLREGDGWLDTDLSDNPFVSFIGPRPRRGLTAVNGHHIEKRKCNTATCVTQRLADFLIRSSNTIGTVSRTNQRRIQRYGKETSFKRPFMCPSSSTASPEEQ